MDLILDGGMFNGSYLIGCMYFLKEMEKQNYIKIERISGCSIGSIMGFLYFIDGLQLAETLYSTFFNNFKNHHHLPVIMNLYDYLKDYIPNNICDITKKKFFITYYNVISKKKIIRNKYKNVQDIICSLIKSCFVPFVINKNLLFQEKYIDGINPYIFPIKQRKILYLDLYGYDKLCNIISVKQEKTNIHRILNGLLDIHTFFIKQTNTSICSYVNDWNLKHKIVHIIKLKLEKINISIIYFILFLKKHFPLEYQGNPTCIMISNMLYDIYNNFIGNYCV
jgi:hypothetical protein